MDRCVIILGGNGFLGKNLCNKFIENGISPYVLDKMYNCDLTTDKGQQALKNLIICNYDKTNEIDVIMMAAQLGSKLFDSSPIEPFTENITIDTKTIDTLKCLSKKKKIHVSYYSTSEVYGNNLKCNLPVIDPTYPRALYAQEKLLVETLLNYEYSIGTFLSLRIFRPFNVSGKHQRRGVMFEMVKSAIEENVIRYSPNQSREITFVQDATDCAYDMIMNHMNRTINLTSKKHINLKDLAYCIKNVIENMYPLHKNIKIIEMPYMQTYIMNRGTTKTMKTRVELNDFIEKLIEYDTIKNIIDEL